jgi:hypothetical protein
MQLIPSDQFLVSGNTGNLLSVLTFDDSVASRTAFPFGSVQTHLLDIAFSGEAAVW